MLRVMALPSRLRDLDDRVLRDRSTPARQEWGQRHGWSLFLLLGLVVLAACAWGLATDRPAVAGMNLGLGVFFVVVGVVLRVRRA
jgi:hypothetical protein